ncbi:hypothetical protein SEUBUCD646_0P02080 [Saccharomyces eubayanus]|uniref:YPL077C-like protein n=2 Tax=Saccharomyces TaxID=4930 RepID=A0ABN8VPJ1_SACEU|nr:hypothetical protein SEUBUCD650_0P02090 [Saccharomyces eubayanus]CAI1797298.1 hypothetical protein SEUBUCD646_0P02080 [Saccharomyces eubayanus]
MCTRELLTVDVEMKVGFFTIDFTKLLAASWNKNRHIKNSSMRNKYSTHKLYRCVILKDHLQKASRYSKICDFMDDLKKKSSVRRQVTNEDDEQYGGNSLHELPRTIPNVNPYTRSRGFRPSYSSQGPATRSLFNNFYNRSSANTVGNDTIDTDSVSYNGVSKFRRNSVDIPLQTHNRLEVRPIVDRQDYLWRGINALDDVKRQAQATELYDQFPQGFENKLMRLRQAHSKLLQVLRDRNAKLEEEQRREVAVATAAAMMTRTPSPTGKSVGDEATSNNIHSSSATRNPNGPNVDPEEGKYVQELVDTIRVLQ